jgi:hypothetical protein
LALSATLCGIPFRFVALPSKAKSSQSFAVMAAQEAKGDADQEKAFELELEALNVELATVRIERDKQRQQLEQLTQEQTELQSSKGQRMKRNKISEQLQDLEICVSKKERTKHLALEELEQAKSHHRQLKRTLELLKGGVQDIVDRSSNDYLDTSIEGTRRSALRQELLNNILRHNWQNFTAPQPTHHGDEDSEADDIQEWEDDEAVGLFGPTAGNASRLSTASSSTTRTRSARSSDRSERSPGRNTPRRTRSEQSKSVSSSLGSISQSSEQKLGRRAPMRSQSEQSGRSLASVEKESRRKNSRSKSAKRRREQRKNQQQQASIGEESKSRIIPPMAPAAPTARQKTSLIQMLERGQEDESTTSEGTPKTCNTREA